MGGITTTMSENVLPKVIKSINSGNANYTKKAFRKLFQLREAESPSPLEIPNMQLDKNICERARLAKDTRFDGLFFTGVLSTGIYCRPICPAPAPKPANIVYFNTAAAAAEAGLRPCLRCRPEASPGTPAWSGTSATVSRAMLLIRQDALNEGSVEDLADKLGVGSRHLRRLFHTMAKDTHTLTVKTSLEAFIKKLTRIPGIGNWTAQYIAMRALSEPDAFPAADLGIMKALQQGAKRPTPKQVLAIAANWRPWRAYAAIYLWHD